MYESTPTCPLSLAADVLASLDEPWNVEEFDVAAELCEVALPR